MAKRQTFDVADAYRDDDSDSYRKPPDTDYDGESRLEESSSNNYEKQLREYQRAIKEANSLQRKKTDSNYEEESNRNASKYGRDSSNKFGDSTTPVDKSSVYNAKQGGDYDYNDVNKYYKSFKENVE